MLVPDKQPVSWFYGEVSTWHKPEASAFHIAVDSRLVSFVTFYHNIGSTGWNGAAAPVLCIVPVAAHGSAPAVAFYDNKLSRYTCAIYNTPEFFKYA